MQAEVYHNFYTRNHQYDLGHVIVQTDGHCCTLDLFHVVRNKQQDLIVHCDLILGVEVSKKTTKLRSLDIEGDMKTLVTVKLFVVDSTQRQRIFDCAMTGDDAIKLQQLVRVPGSFYLHKVYLNHPRHGKWTDVFLSFQEKKIKIVMYDTTDKLYRAIDNVQAVCYEYDSESRHYKLTFECRKRLRKDDDYWYRYLLMVWVPARKWMAMEPDFLRKMPAIYPLPAVPMYAAMPMYFVTA